MKAINILLIAVTVVFVSCQKKPTACFTTTPATLTVHDDVRFTNCSTEGYSYQWNFGDGVKSNMVAPSHTYHTVGTYEVTLKATSKNEWKYEKVTSPNGTDVTSYYVNRHMEIKKDGNFISDNGVGTWQFGSDKEIIVFTFSGGSSMTWNIIKLKNNELWTTYASSSPGGLYQYHLSPR